ncbi:hypothetical protein QR680_013473 [Steinernema hermaphroditum]|uniref:Uncharacterized protein n=1 Tax=Steinernema hermaphroditum TaxID=289476 RepID=A0AA39M2C1_9BILA|nr:hypothetical protein QR680_013473 [Steinernema hermaphroditum]
MRSKYALVHKHEVTVNCTERGVLLFCVRDELPLPSYKNVLVSAYGVRKAITVERQQMRAVVECDEEIEKNRQLEQRLASERLSNEEEMGLLKQRRKNENPQLLDANKALKVEWQDLGRAHSRIRCKRFCTSKRATKSEKRPKNSHA